MPENRPAEPADLFPAFYSNAAIGDLAHLSRWTISGMLGDVQNSPESSGTATRKAPIDIKHLRHGCSASCTHTGPLRGAWSQDDQCLMTLTELSDFLPTAANVAFYSRAVSDGYAVLDIEPSCPPAIAAALLQLPGAHYTEVSMSGRGFHMLFDLPSNIFDVPHASSKRVLREEHGWYEILLDHWVTFTRQPIHSVNPAALSVTPEASFAASITTFEDLYADLAAHSAITPTVSTLHVHETMPKIPFSEVFIDAATSRARTTMRSPEDFHNDLSRWEFSVLGILYRSLGHTLEPFEAAGVTLSLSDQAWLLYESAQIVLPHRPKHDERRNGRPYLLDRAVALIATDRERHA